MTPWPTWSSDALAGLAGPAPGAPHRTAPTTPGCGASSPTAYHDDPDRDQEYQLLARDELLAGRLASLDLLGSLAEVDELDADGASTILRAINDVRLVIGTILDVSEDDGSFDPDDPGARPAPPLPPAHRAPRRGRRGARPGGSGRREREPGSALMSATGALIGCRPYPQRGANPGHRRGVSSPHRLAAWDTALSRRQHGFESRWGCCSNEHLVPWCSLECTPACQAGGRGFKSRRDRHQDPRSGSSVGRASA